MSVRGHEVMWKDVMWDNVRCCEKMWDVMKCCDEIKARYGFLGERITEVTSRNEKIILVIR